MRYVSRPAECEAMQWGNTDAMGFYATGKHAENVVAWVNANGGHARYEPEPQATIGGRGHGSQTFTQPARIAVRTINGWAYAAPGHYVVRGSAEFEGRTDPAIRCPECGSAQLMHTSSCSRQITYLRDFYPCDPETFQNRWFAAGGVMSP